MRVHGGCRHLLAMLICCCLSLTAPAVASELEVEASVCDVCGESDETALLQREIRRLQSWADQEGLPMSLEELRQQEEADRIASDLAQQRQQQEQRSAETSSQHAMPPPQATNFLVQQTSYDMMAPPVPAGGSQAGTISISQSNLPALLGSGDAARKSSGAPVDGPAIFFEVNNLAPFAQSIATTLGAQSIEDLKLVDSDMADKTIKSVGLPLIPAKNFRHAIAELRGGVWNSAETASHRHRTVANRTGDVQTLISFFHTHGLGDNAEKIISVLGASHVDDLKAVDNEMMSVAIQAAELAIIPAKHLINAIGELHREAEKTAKPHDSPQQELLQKSAQQSKDKPEPKPIHMLAQPVSSASVLPEPSSSADAAQQQLAALELERQKARPKPMTFAELSRGVVMRNLIEDDSSSIDRSKLTLKLASLLDELERTVNGETDKLLDQVSKDLRPLQEGMDNLHGLMGEVQQKFISIQQETGLLEGKPAASLSVPLSVRMNIPTLTSAFSSVQESSQDALHRMTTARAEMTDRISDMSHALKGTLRQVLSDTQTKGDAMKDLKSLLDEHVVDAQFTSHLLQTVQGALNKVRDSVLTTANEVHSKVALANSMPKEDMLMRYLGDFDMAGYDRLADGLTSTLSSLMVGLPKNIELVLKGFENAVTDGLGKAHTSLLKEI
eukprot:gnl/TRDRNA2_/TRDRNA2_35177_c0_seq1.p1 gnl/TRDRNA2_/TRDRNA2_35177_c0~~gnl/TRDRNA2_/TRDRNA2_35177_c0_seq1.p1  ORF type:complete len:672 (-),score=163.34 gnl/TRDRNA2_/TRDRNA2_35177_c0_seq1:92-2107(-)